MQIILKDQNTYILSLQRGEEIIQELESFCQKNKIEAGVFTGVGAVMDTELAYYDVDKKEYFSKVFKEKLEIAGMLGNAARMKDKIIIHSHGVFSDKEMQVKGGHINKAVVAAACEITFTNLAGKIEREYSEEIGLNLMKK